MNRLDEALRRGICAPAGRALRMACAFFGAALFLALLFLTPLLPRDAADGAAPRMLLCLLLTAPYLLLLSAAGPLREAESVAGMLLLSSIAACGMLLRLVFLTRPSPDFENYLNPWMAKMADASFREVMRGEFSEYNVLYQYLLFLAARMPFARVASVKLVSLWGDCLLTAGLVRLAKGRGRGLAAFALGLFLPTFVLNGGMFAQCDSLYTAAAVWGLALALEGRHTGAAACFAVSLAFKLQAVFLFPILPVLFADRKLRLSDAAVFLLALVLTALPALFAGKSPAAIPAYYAGQTGLYTGLTYNAPTFFGLMNTEGLDVYAYGRFGMLLSAGVCLLIAALGIFRAGRLSGREILRLSALSALCAAFFLPRMHERYFYLAEALLCALTALDERRAPGLLLAEAACFSRLWDLGIGLKAASLLMLFCLFATAAPLGNPGGPERGRNGEPGRNAAVSQKRGEGDRRDAGAKL